MKKKLKRYKIKLPRELREALDTNSRNWYLFKALTESQRQEYVLFIMAGTSRLKRIARAKTVVALLNGNNNLLKFYPC